MEYPPRPIPDTVGHYGENGIAFEGICGRFYGFVEYEKELPAFDVTNFALVPGGCQKGPRDDVFQGLPEGVQDVAVQGPCGRGLYDC